MNGIVATGRYGLYGPRGTLRAVVERSSQTVQRIVTMPDIQEQRFSGLNLEPVGSTPEAFAAFLKEDLEKDARIAKAAGSSRNEFSACAVKHFAQ